MDDIETLNQALAFHGHKCWASTAGVRLGLAAMRELGATRAAAKELHAIIETGDYLGVLHQRLAVDAPLGNAQRAREQPPSELAVVGHQLRERRVSRCRDGLGSALDGQLDTGLLEPDHDVHFRRQCADGHHHRHRDLLGLARTVGDHDQELLGCFHLAGSSCSTAGRPGGGVS